uniref:DNA 3'-5' helicase n=1 Tax=Caenorhabditis tropicalis TaxID=1561998 RepID=A0A1I7TUW4_9PELO
MSDDEELPATCPNSENEEDELPETEENNDELPETDPDNDSDDSFDQPKSTRKPVAEEDYDSFDDFVPSQAVPAIKKSTETKRKIEKTLQSESSSSEDSDAGNDSEFIPIDDDSQASQRRKRGYALRTRTSVKTKSDSWDDGFDDETTKISEEVLNDSLEDSEFMDSILDENVTIKRKHGFLDEGEFFTDREVVRVDEETKAKWANMVTPPKEALDALNEFYGHKKFREKQWDVVRNVLSGKDQFVLMSTGYGKSVCYQLPSLLLNTLTIVVSPLISLMNDQVTTLVAKGIDAVKLDGNSTLKEWERVSNNFNRIRFIYMSPEMVTSMKGLELLSMCREQISLLAIDEAHCVSQWGHDFRNSYRHLAAIRNRSDLCNIPMIALTATATVRVRDDVIQNLMLRKPHITTTSFDRKILYISVHSSKDLSTDMGPYLETDEVKGRHFGGPTIIYCQTKQMVDEVNSALRRIGVRSAHYHAGLTKNQREKAHTEFMRDKITTIVATVAFGMGIDKPDVRNVIHYGCPKDIESYYQEIGRAGRDGAPSVCRVFWAPKDLSTIKFKLRNSQLQEEVIENLTLMLRQLELVLTTAGCRRYQLLKHFDPSYAKPTTPQADCCDRCTEMINGNQDVMSSTIDVTTESKWLFQVIMEMYNGKTGIGKPLEFLRGSTKEEWRMKTMTQKQLFGIGKNLSDKWWKALGSTLRLAGYLGEVRPMQMKFGSCVVLTDLAEEWLLSGKEMKIDATPTLLQGKKEKNVPKALTGLSRTQTPAMVPANEKKILGAKKKREYKSAQDIDQLKNIKEKMEDGLPEKIRMLRVRLDDLRVEMASMYEMAPFQVVSNSVLDGFASLRPSSITKLENIDGMSAAQKSKYGKRFVDCVVRFSKENQIPMDAKSTDTIPSQITAIMEKELSDSIKRVYMQHLVSKTNAKDTAIARGISEGTVYNYLVIAIEKGLPVYLDKLNVTRKQIALALNAARVHLGSNVIRLAPWKEPLGDDIDYNQLKIIRAVLIYEFGVETNSDDASPNTSPSSSKPSINSTPSTIVPPTRAPPPKRFKL